MSLGEADMSFARELLSDIPDLTTRRMFGGMGLYSEGVIFALMMSDGRLMLKAAKGPFADRMAALGGEEWTYTRKSGTQSAMPYWTLPDAYLDDPEEACALAREALDALR
ncbi:TfoX/Sxy family protein [Sulfitobacter donghicola]|uniref:TfoX-like protein n=1 Tax=Sulfitobacter donghicola DSW-25 = KCTC 12864 = JCM 14565 TaxID=1300350 RepID=A0A073IIX4_9RHOB|nr:TfoX/Sxy family protein [Sulfitobacter donghicola]KEJ90278.1 TfoX-like protein [Sulfitobacter donghicola DSW-25 = KCTC 12864 = JCM 14565]KIN66551.1 TfoX-like protein [Sulfitobacter donghicola DSW-25 = KCTC 12864 = JCM 14565]